MEDLGPSDIGPINLSNVTDDSDDNNISASSSRYSFSEYSNSSPSVNLPSAPYPVESVVESPIASTSSLTYTDSYGSSAQSPNFNRSTSQTTHKSNPLKPLISTPITNMTNDIRNTPPSSSNMVNPTFRGHHKLGSISSLWSTGSQKNVNLATLKKTLNLHPGEGERSNYVLTLRKNAGTAYNENGPLKWKLPVGIAPIDRRSTYNTNNTKYMRLVGGVSQSKAKKGTGVELKHGHLAPRLLASEVDDRDDASVNFGMKKPLITPTTTTTSTATESSLALSSGSANTLSRTITDTSTASKSPNPQSPSLNSSLDDSPTVEALGSFKSRRSSVSSGTGSVAGMNNGYYQHPSYKYDEYDENEEFDATELEYEEPRLVLANPDTDSD